MRNDPDLMRTERNLWRGATTLTIGILLLMTLQTRPDRRDAATLSFGTPRFDEPGAAARSDLARRQPVDARLDMPQLYAAASLHVASLARYSSRVGRDLPNAQPASRVW